MPEEEQGRHSAVCNKAAALIKNFNEGTAGYDYVSEAVPDALTADSAKARYAPGPTGRSPSS